jgi:glycosyltransferase involved in cell wall biosynthesis
MSKISVVMPCLNEEKTIGACIEKTQEAFRQHKLNGEIVIGDNGSTDKSIEIAKNLGARVACQSKKGYGNAYHAAIAAAKGEYIVMGDSDNTYDFSKIYDFITPLDKGYDMVIGDRFVKKIKREAMPFLHRYLGNPVLSAILRLFFKVKVHDAHCGMRSFTREAYDKLRLETEGMEYASEMIIAAARENLKIKEIPIDYGVRVGESKLETFKDGWRHLKFMLILSPSYLFLAPGLFLFLLGLILVIWMTFGPIKLGRISLDIHPIFLGALLTILGFQIVSFGFFTKIYAYSQGLIVKSRTHEIFENFFSLERMLRVGIFVTLLGAVLGAYVFYTWMKVDFGQLFEIRKSLTAMILLILGLQIVFSAFFYSILDIHGKNK